MDERINKLLRLQEIDIEIRDLEQAAAAYPARLKEIDDELAADRAVSDARQAELDELEKQRRNIEANIQLQKEQVRKWEARLAEIKTPREYAALSREIDIAKKGMRNQEEEVLGLMEQAEALRNEIEKIEREILEKEKGHEAERTELQDKLAHLESETQRLSGGRDAATEGIDKRLLRQYDLIRSRRAGVALAAVTEGATCGACRMRILPQLYNDLVSGQAGIAKCPSCNRILYVPDADDEDENVADEAHA